MGHMTQQTVTWHWRTVVIQPGQGSIPQGAAQRKGCN